MGEQSTVRAHHDDGCGATHDCATRDEIRGQVGHGCEVLFVGKHPFGSKDKADADAVAYEVYVTQQAHMLTLVAFERQEDGHWKEHDAMGLPRDVRTVERLLRFATNLPACEQAHHDHRNSAPGKP